MKASTGFRPSFIAAAALLLVSQDAAFVVFQSRHAHPAVFHKMPMNDPQRRKPIFSSILSIDPQYFDGGGNQQQLPNNNKRNNNPMATLSAAILAMLTHNAAHDVSSHAMIMDATGSANTPATHSFLLMDTADALASQSDAIAHYPSMLDALPVVEQADVFNGMSHICLDGLASLGDSTMIGVRLAVFLGYIFSLLADWLPDQTMDDPAEFAFNVVMLYCALSSFCNSVVHEAVARFATPVSHKDMRAFKLLFEPAGVSFHQYKYLLSESIIDWVSLAEGESVEDSNYCYWLYNGAVSIENASGVPHVLRSSPTFRKTNPTAMLGDMKFLEKLDLHEEDGNEHRFTTPRFAQLFVNFGKDVGCDRDNDEECSVGLCPDEVWGALGPLGASLLRIDTKAALHSLEDDESIGVPLRRLLLTAIQAKLNLSATNTERSNGNERS